MHLARRIPLRPYVVPGWKTTQECRDPDAHSSHGVFCNLRYNPVTLKTVSRNELAGTGRAGHGRDGLVREEIPGGDAA